MQSGYRLNFKPQSVAFKASLRNIRNDNVLYGIDIKTENKIQDLVTPLTNSIKQVTQSTQTTLQPGYNETTRQYVPLTNTNLATVPMTALNAYRSHRTELGDVNFVDKSTKDDIKPEDSVSNIGDARSKVSIPSGVESTLNRVINKIDLKELKEKVALGRKGLKPVAERQLITPIKPAEATPVNTTTPSEAPTAPVTEFSEVSSNSAQPSISEETTQVANREVSVLETPEEAGNASTGSNVQNELIQKLAKDFLKKVKPNSKSSSVSKSITPYKFDNSKLPENIRLQVKLFDNQISFNMLVANNGQATVNDTNNKNKKTIEIDVYKSIQYALDKLKSGTYNTDPRTGEMTGFGVRNLQYYNETKKRANKNLIVYLNKIAFEKENTVRLTNGKREVLLSRSNVSEPFKNIVKDIVKRNTYEPEDYEMIRPNEAADVNKFIRLTKAVVPSNVKRINNADTVYKLKKHYEVLVGELSSGNYGQLLRKEMQDVLRELARLKAIDRKKAATIINNLKSDFK